MPRTARVPLVFAVLATFCIAGCDAGRAPAAAPLAPVAAPTLSPRATVVPQVDPAAPDAVATTDPQEILDRISEAPQPPGTGAQIALRFLQGLQRRDDVAAARELSSIVRFWLPVHPMARLLQIMDDVRRHAGLDGAGRCRRSRELADDSAAVFCGTTVVVVHLTMNGSLSGVLISDVHVHYDVYRGPHTHAYTSL